MAVQINSFNQGRYAQRQKILKIIHRRWCNSRRTGTPRRRYIGQRQGNVMGPGNGRLPIDDR
uniref:Uncharacterized protein n=1 Tax=Romanomermis culicivorax TaxID=13658 RepID=A0A915IAQ5_ROMCU